MLLQTRTCSRPAEPRQTTTRRHLTWNGLLLLVFLFGLTGSADSRPHQAKNEDAIRKQLAGYADARTNGSGERQASFYAEDGDEWELFADQKTSGRNAIANLLQLAPDPNRHFRLEILDIISLTSDSALVDAHWFRETSPKPKGRVHYYMVKKHGQWLIQSARINPYPPRKG
jgi:hypothetical protein